jgi:hypothetical protein
MGVCVLHRFLFNFYKARIVSVTIFFGLDLQQLQAAANNGGLDRHPHDEFNCNQTTHAHIALDCHLFAQRFARKLEKKQK